MRLLRLGLWLATVGLAGWCLAQTAPPAGPDDDGAPDAPSTQPDRLGRPHGLRHPGPGRAGVPLSERQRQQVLDFLRTEQRDLFDALEKVRQEAPQRYEAMLNQAGWPTLVLIDMRQGNPELYAIVKEEMLVSRRITDLGVQLAQTQDAGPRSELVNQLRAELIARFDLAQERQRLEVRQFKLRIERLEAMLQTRQANRDKIIEAQLQQIIESASDPSAGQSALDVGGARPAAAIRMHPRPAAGLPANPPPTSQPQ